MLQVDLQQLQQLMIELANQKELNSTVTARASQKEIDDAVKQINSAVQSSPLSASAVSQIARQGTPPSPTELQELRDKSSRDRLRCSSLESELQELKGRIADECTKQQIGCDADREEELMLEVTRLQTELRSESEVIKKLRTQAQAGLQSASQLQRERAVNTKMTADLQAEIESLAAELQGATEQLSTTQQTNAELNSALNSAESAFGALQGEVNEVKAAKAELEGQSNRAANEQQAGSDELRSQLSEALASNEELKAKFFSATKQIPDAMEQLHSMQNELSSEKEESQALREQLAPQQVRLTHTARLF